jgi:hypothetical protein
MRTQDAKLAVYSHWKPGTTEIDFDERMELEFYDYSTPGGAAEVDNTPHDSRARQLANTLLRNLIPHELQEPLPAPLRLPQAETQRHLIEYLQFIEGISEEEWLAGAGRTILGYGFNVP